MIDFRVSPGVKTSLCRAPKNADNKCINDYSSIFRASSLGRCKIALLLLHTNESIQGFPVFPRWFVYQTDHEKQNTKKEKKITKNGKHKKERRECSMHLYTNVFVILRCLKKKRF